MDIQKKSVSSSGHPFCYSVIVAASLSAFGLAGNAVAHTTGKSHGHNTAASYCHPHSHTHVSPVTGERVTHTHQHCHAAGTEHESAAAHKHHPIRGAVKKTKTAKQPVYREPMPVYQAPAPVYQAPPPPPIVYQAPPPPPVYQAPAPVYEAPPVVVPMPRVAEPVVINTGWEQRNRSIGAAVALSSANSVLALNSVQLNRQVISSENKQAYGGGLSLRYQGNFDGDSGKGIFLSGDYTRTQARHRIIENTTNVELYNEKKGYTADRGSVKLGYVAYADEGKQFIPYLEGTMGQQKVSYPDQSRKSSAALLGLIIQTKATDALVFEANLGLGRVLSSKVTQPASATVASSDLDLGKGNAVSGGVRVSYDLSTGLTSYLDITHRQERLNSDQAKLLNMDSKKETEARLGLGWKY